MSHLLVPVGTPSPGHDRFIVSHGKGGALGVFTAADAMMLKRGQKTIVQTDRGVEVGTVLCAATDRKAALLGATAAGRLLRCFTPDDEARRADRATLEQQLFQAARTWAIQDGLGLEILDVDLLFDASSAIVQFVGADADTESFALKLEQQFGVTIRLENLAVPSSPEEETHGCDKPDCGRESGGCTSCSTGAGCSSCGSSKVDLREYFGHLRTKMEGQNRVPLA